MLHDRLEEIQRLTIEIKNVLERHTGLPCGNSLRDVLSFVRCLPDLRERRFCVLGVPSNVRAELDLEGIYDISDSCISVYGNDVVTHCRTVSYDADNLSTFSGTLPLCFSDSDVVCCWYPPTDDTVLSATDEDSCIYIKGNAMCITQEEPLNSAVYESSGGILTYNGDCGFKCDAGTYEVRNVHSLYIKKNNIEYLFVPSTDGFKNIL